MIESGSTLSSAITPTPLNIGTYADDGQGSPTGMDAEGLWTVSPPLAHDGVPRVLEALAAARGG